MDKEFTICTTCPIQHYDDCPDCFGFGIYENGVPVNATDATEHKLRGKVVKCATCLSDENGVPNNALDKQTEFTTALIALLKKYNVNIDAADDYDGEDNYSGTTYSLYGDGIDIDLKELKRLLYDNTFG